MINICTRTIFFFLIYFTPFSGITQNYAVKESTTLVPDFLHAYFQIGSEHYLAINYSSPHGALSSKRDEWTTTATIYDKTLRQVSSGLVKELVGKKYETAIRFSQHIQLVYSDAQGTVYTCEFVGDKAAFAGTPKELFTVSNENEEFESGFSEDSAYVYLLCKSYEKKGKDEACNGVILDRQMNIVTKFSFTLEGLREYIANTACTLSDKGLLHVITAVRVKSSKADYRPLQYLVTEVGSDGKSGSVQLNDLPEGLMANLIWSPEAEGFSFTGLLAKTKKAGFTTIITGHYSNLQSRVSDIKEAEFSNAVFFQNASAKYLRELAKEGIPAEARLIGSFTSGDHAIILILEPSEIIFTSRGNFSYTDTETGNIYIVRINAKKELDWVQTVPKKQQEPSNPVYTGTIAMSDGMDGVVIFYHDDERNEKLEGGNKAAGALLGGDWRHLSLAAVHIGKEGNVSKKFIIDDYHADLLLAPARSFSIYNKELIYTAYNLKNLGKSTYRIGVIKIN